MRDRASVKSFLSISLTATSPRLSRSRISEHRSLMTEALDRNSSSSDLYDVQETSDPSTVSINPRRSPQVYSVEFLKNVECNVGFTMASGLWINQGGTL